MKKIAALIAIISTGILASLPAYSEHVDYHKEELKIINHDGHNASLNQCIKVALKRHPGAITEVEVELEDGKTIIDVDVQGKDGKNWEVECDVATGEVIEDSEKSDDKQESNKKKSGAK
jgi:uncharacterized membrane protein YkoI